MRDRKAAKNHRVDDGIDGVAHPDRERERAHCGGGKRAFSPHQPEGEAHVGAQIAETDWNPDVARLIGGEGAAAKRPMRRTHGRVGIDALLFPLAGGHVAMERHFFRKIVVEPPPVDQLPDSPDEIAHGSCSTWR